RRARAGVDEVAVDEKFVLDCCVGHGGRIILSHMKDTLIRLLIISNIALLIVAAAPKKSSVLTVSQLDIVDSKGVVRARLAGNLPETYANGKAIGRGAAGMLLYDASGTERGGYVTFANDH